MCGQRGLGSSRLRPHAPLSSSCQQRPGAAWPEAHLPGPVSSILTAGGRKQSHEQSKCDEATWWEVALVPLPQSVDTGG